MSTARHPHPLQPLPKSETEPLLMATLITTMSSSMMQEPVTHQQSEGRLCLSGFLESVDKKAYRIAWLSTGQHADALDIVQDAMLKLVNKYGDTSDEHALRLLFFRILNNTIIDWHRKSVVRKKVHAWFGRHSEDDSETEHDLASAAPDNAPGPEQLNNAANIGASIDRALRQLPVRQRQAFLLRQQEGLSVKETAAIMECSEGSVKTHLSRALSQLRGQLAEVFQQEVLSASDAGLAVWSEIGSPRGSPSVSVGGAAKRSARKNNE